MPMPTPHRLPTRCRPVSHSIGTAGTDGDEQAEGAGDVAGQHRHEHSDQQREPQPPSSHLGQRHARTGSPMATATRGASTAITSDLASTVWNCGSDTSDGVLLEGQSPLNGQEAVVGVQAAPQQRSEPGDQRPGQQQTGSQRHESPHRRGHYGGEPERAHRDERVDDPPHGRAARWTRGPATARTSSVSAWSAPASRWERRRRSRRPRRGSPTSVRRGAPAGRDVHGRGGSAVELHLVEGAVSVEGGEQDFDRPARCRSSAGSRRRPSRRRRSGRMTATPCRAARMPARRRRRPRLCSVRDPLVVTTSPSISSGSPRKPATKVVAGLAYSSGTGSALHDAAAVHDGDAVADHQRFTLVVGDVDDRDAELAVDAGEFELHGFA